MVRCDGGDGVTLTDSQLAQLGIGISHHFGGDVYIKETLIPAGGALAQHAHSHDHQSYLVSGRVALTVDGATEYLNAPARVLIRAGKEHAVHAIKQSLWLCIWATDCTDQEKVDAAVTA